MATGQMNEVIQHLRRAVLLRDGAGLTDGQLLKDYLSRREEAALEALVLRHGPMVWGVCRRVLRNWHDAEDAFQATFLVLVRKAASIASPDLLANWLYGVAHQTALKARATAAKRKARERQVLEMPEPAATAQDLWIDLQPLLDQELSRLPDKYRVAVVLCDLEGKTRKEAARQLGVPEGTFAARLARGRVRLAKRLAGHGLAVSGGTLAAVLSQSAAPACVPASIVVSTIKGAGLFAVGQTAAQGVIAIKVAALADGVLKTMWLTKLKTAIAGLLAVVCIVGAGLGANVITRQATAAEPATGEQPKNDKPAKEAKDKLEGTWTLLSIETDGAKVYEAAKVPAEKQITVVIAEGKFVSKQGDKTEEMPFKIDPAKKPREIDLSLPRPVFGEMLTRPGIYSLEGDTLSLCFDNALLTRPSEFATKAGDRRGLWMLKRVGKPERPKKLARMPEPSPELRKELYAFDDFRHGSEERFVELEGKADELLKKYTARDDQARIYFEVAHVAAQSDIRNHVQRVRKYAGKSLALSRDPLQRGVLYSYLGSAAEVEGEKTFEDRRRRAATELLTGYAEMLAQDLPAKAPELPVVNKIGDEVLSNPDPANAAQASARHAAQMAARQEAEFIRELVDRRDTLANQLRWLYHPDSRIHGRNPYGPEQLKALAGKVLNDPKAVEALLKRVTEP